MPAQERLRADQEREPTRARQPPAEAGERQTISRSPARLLDLALEDTRLVPEDQEFQPEAGVRPVAVDVRLAHPVARRLLGHPQVLGDLGQGFVAGPDQAHRLGTEGRRVVWLAYVVQGARGHVKVRGGGQPKSAPSTV